MALLPVATACVELLAGKQRTPISGCGIGRTRVATFACHIACTAVEGGSRGGGGGKGGAARKKRKAKQRRLGACECAG